MTPDERQLVTGLFDRMRGYSLPEKDGEAEALINSQVAGLRDAPYMLVQSVLVQEHALQQADARIGELEEQLRELQGAAQPQQQAAGSGSFLGGLFGSRPAAEPARGAASVPAIGSRATPSAYGSRSAWAQQAAGQQPAAGPFAQGAQQPGQQPGGGGFLRSAMATAAGVAGGMLVAGAIGNMLGGSSASASTGQQSASASDGAKETSQAQDASASSNASQESAVQETSDDGGGWFGGDDGGDFDI